MHRSVQRYELQRDDATSDSDRVRIYSVDLGDTLAQLDLAGHVTNVVSVLAATGASLAAGDDAELAVRLPPAGVTDDSRPEYRSSVRRCVKGQSLHRADAGLAVAPDARNRDRISPAARW